MPEVREFMKGFSAGIMLTVFTELMIWVVIEVARRHAGHGKPTADALVGLLYRLALRGMAIARAAESMLKAFRDTKADIKKRYKLEEVPLKRDGSQ